MSAETLLSSLKLLGVELTARGETLHVSTPKGMLAPELRAKLLAHKPELLVLLRARGGEDRNQTSFYEVPEGWSTESWIKRLRYLAGVCVHAGRATELREWAEALDRMETARRKGRAPP